MLIEQWRPSGVFTYAPSFHHLMGLQLPCSTCIYSDKVTNGCQFSGHNSKPWTHCEHQHPLQINLNISYAPVFSATALPITLRSLAFERAAVLFNLGALYSQLASSEDRSTLEGLKRAIAHYQVRSKLLHRPGSSDGTQNAAGTFSFLTLSALPGLEFAPVDENIPLDLTDAFVKSLEFLMLAQAQECVWQKAVIGKSELIPHLLILTLTKIILKTD